MSCGCKKKKKVVVPQTNTVKVVEGDSSKLSLEESLVQVENLIKKVDGLKDPESGK